MSHSFIDRTQNYYNVDSDSDIPQQKIDPVAQLKWLNTPQVHGEWGLFRNEPANNETMQMSAEEEIQRKDEEETTPLHQDIIDTAKKWSLDDDEIKWTTGDIIKWKTTGGSSYLFNRKSEFVGFYKDVIKDASAKFNIPVFLLAGVAFTEFGGDPMWIDDIAYDVRSFDWSGPDWVDENLTMTSIPDKTSFGNLSIQIRTAAETLGYDPREINSKEKSNIKDSLKDPVQNIYIAAKHLSDLRNVDFKGASAADLTSEQIKIISTRYNRGAGLSLERIKENLSYGNSIYKHESEINAALLSN